MMALLGLSEPSLSVTGIVVGTKVGALCAHLHKPRKEGSTSFAEKVGHKSALDDCLYGSQWGIMQVSALKDTRENSEYKSSSKLCLDMQPARDGDASILNNKTVV